MTTASATSEAVKLLPGRTIICNESYQSTHHGDFRTEEIRYGISVHPAIIGEEPCQLFRAPSFHACLDQIRAAIQNETTKQ